MYSEQEPETNLSTLQTSFVDSDSPLKGSVLDLSGDQEELPVSVRRVRQSSTLTPFEGPVGLAPLPAPPSDAHHSALFVTFDSKVFSLSTGKHNVSLLNLYVFRLFVIVYVSDEMWVLIVA